jgi:MtaA/CmuA family methyltransferase
MTGRERVRCVLDGATPDRAPVLPILHTGLVPLLGASMREYATDAATMADVIIAGQRRFGYDGVQLSLGVIGEAEALGARVDQPADGAPVLAQQLLADGATLAELRERDPTSGGRMPMFFEATARVVDEIGDDAFVLPTMRGPLLIASQLRGVEQILMDCIDRPGEVEELLDFATDVALRLARRLLATGAGGLALGEATCSPNFISPRLYRELVHPRHVRLIGGLKEVGWGAVGFHICGDTTPIMEDIIATRADFMDVDHQVPAERAREIVGDRIALRGNLDPSAVLRFGSADEVRSATRALCRAVTGSRWIVSSGCDIPPGTPAENIAALVEGVDG